MKLFDTKFDNYLPRLRVRPEYFSNMPPVFLGFIDDVYLYEYSFFVDSFTDSSSIRLVIYNNDGPYCNSLNGPLSFTTAIDTNIVLSHNGLYHIELQRPLKLSKGYVFQKLFSSKGKVLVRNATIKDTMYWGLQFDSLARAHMICPSLDQVDEFDKGKLKGYHIPWFKIAYFRRRDD